MNEGDTLGQTDHWPTKYAVVRCALQTLLDACDYTEGHCDPAEAVCEAISPEVLAMARKALAR